jgi:hypothetical protein
MPVIIGKRRQKGKMINIHRIAGLACVFGGGTTDKLMEAIPAIINAIYNISRICNSSFK